MTYKALVEVCRGDFVKDLSRLGFSIDEILHIVEDFLGHFDAVGVSNRILSQEIQVDGQGLSEASSVPHARNSSPQYQLPLQCLSHHQLVEPICQ